MSADTITLNGQPHTIPGEIPLDRLLSGLGLEGKPVVVELDGRAVLPHEHCRSIVKPGARVEIVTLAAGG